MGKGGKVNRRNFKRSVRARDISSDDSDEDYVVELEGNRSGDDSEDLGNSIDEYESDEGFGRFIEEDEDEEGYRKVVRSKTIKGSRAITKNRGKISRKRKRLSYEEEEEEEEDDDDDFVNDEEDEEFSPGDDDDDGGDDHDFLDEDEELTVSKRSNNMKVAKRTTKKRGTRVRVKKSRVSKKKPLKKRARNKRRLKRKVRLECDDDDEYEGDFINDRTGSREKRRKNSGLRRSCAVSSDSEFVLSGASDYDYTISEEEREQVREASKLFGEVKPSLRSSSSVKKIEEDGEDDVYQHGKSLVRKGKEKLKEVKSEMGKQVCGICLSEEDKRRFRGTLDCCSHYFCFTCIMEWSKVESRCPLCKQRFKTITKLGRAASSLGVDLRNPVIEVPKRDQVYQPSEEEIRSFIDPYENVICTECHEGGDDGLMLLCDICDSPAHTFCVGLGQQVPEGNWYCEGCRPNALGGSSSTQPQEDPLPDQRPSPVQNNGEGFALDSILESSPRLQGFGNIPSPRFSNVDFQVSGTGAPTLSVRRQIHRHIQNLLSINRMHMASRIDSISASNLHGGLLNPQIDQRMPEMQSRGIFLDERLQTNGHPSSSVQNVNPFPLRTDQSGVRRVQDQATTATESPVILTLWPELSGRNSEFHEHSRPSIASGVNLLPHRGREESQFYVVKEQLQSMVKSHLKNLSQDIELGNDTFKEIARSSTHTILAACGLEHKRSEVQVVPAPAICIHGDRLIAGEISIMKGFCSTCFESFARDVVKRIMDTRSPRWLSLGL